MSQQMVHFTTTPSAFWDIYTAAPCPQESYTHGAADVQAEAIHSKAMHDITDLIRISRLDLWIGTVSLGLLFIVVLSEEMDIITALTIATYIDT